MEKIVEQGILFDFYGPLLTDHQQEICRAALFEDLSLAEIAEQYGITRQGVHDLMKRCDHILRDYEEKLGLVGQYRAQSEGLEEVRKIVSGAVTENGELCLNTESTGTLLRLIEQLTGDMED